MKELFSLLKNLTIESRPRQWIKNLAVFVPIYFAGKIFEIDELTVVIKTFISFTLLSSFTYIINDIVDKNKDQEHPQKKHRPIASGKLNQWIAFIYALSILALGLYIAAVESGYFLIIAISYVFLTFLYTVFLKNVAILESIIIAIGFVLRVIAGSVVINIPISSWVTICTISLSLLISFGRKKAEITLLGFKNAAKHRKVLLHYPLNFLDTMITSLSAATFLSYTIFTFNYESNSGLISLTQKIMPDTLQSPKWIMVTIPFTFYCISKYIQIIYTKTEGGEPEKIVTSNKPFIISILVWLLITSLIIYIPSDII